MKLKIHSNLIMLLTLLLPFLLLSCSEMLAISKKSSDTHKLEDYYLSTTNIDYFLRPIPDWINFSETGSCVRKFNPSYLNLPKIMQSYNYTYYESLQFQLLYNYELKILRNKIDTKAFSLSRDFKKSVKATSLQSLKGLNIKSENNLFFTIKEQIDSSIYLFRPPTFSKISLIWIDPLLKQENLFLKFISEIKSGLRQIDGHPIFISLCLSTDEIEEFIEEYKLDEILGDIRIISYEMFSIFNEKAEATTTFNLNFDAIFSKEKVVQLYLPLKTARPSNFKGKLNLLYY